MKKRLRLIRSSNSCVQKVKANLASLKLKKIGDVSEVTLNETTVGRIKKIQHLIVMEDL